MGVAKVVSPDAVNACEVCELLHCTRKPCLCSRKPVVAQYELTVRDDNALHLAPCGEFGKRVLIQIDGADCRTRLRFRELVVRLVVVIERLPCLWFDGLLYLLLVSQKGAEGGKYA